MNDRRPPTASTLIGKWQSFLLMTALSVFFTASLSAQTDCMRTANRMYKACRNDVADDFWTAAAICRNIGDAAERADCHDEATEGRSDGIEECNEVRDARNELCDDLGEERYDPDFDPADFTDVFDNANPYFPLEVGNRWVYEAEDEEIVVEVLDEIKLIEGVTCIVVNDLVSEDGEPIENTDDWYGQALNGDVHYCGELSLNFELFEGDDPEVAELVDIDGSFKAGRDGAKAGIVMFGAPLVGTVYRQEWALGEAEDFAEVLANDYSYGDDAELDELVPQELAELLCADDCVVTREGTALEPEVSERKYYAPGIGLFLETNVEEGEIVVLTECNHHALCASL